MNSNRACGVLFSWNGVGLQEIRLWQNQPFIEIEFSVGPVPIEDGNGKVGASHCPLSFVRGGLVNGDVVNRKSSHGTSTLMWPVKATCTPTPTVGKCSSGC
jgi:hypothetical protein